MPLDGRNLPDHHLLEKLDRVDALLSGPEKWCKQALSLPDGRRCILGAMQAAGAIPDLAPVFLAAIKTTTGRDFLGRVECFNDHPSTDFRDIRLVIETARAMLINGLPIPDPVMTKIPAPSFSFAGWVRSLFGMPPAPAKANLIEKALAHEAKVAKELSKQLV